MISLYSVEGKDDLDFVSICESILNTSIDLLKPDMISVVQIDKWFDHKWLRARAAYPWYNTHETMRTPPLFQVNYKKYYELRNDEYIVVSDEDESLWKREEKKQGGLFRADIKKFENDVLFFWYSSKSALLDHASIMLYSRIEEQDSEWFASFKKDVAWKLHKTKDISRNEVEYLITRKNK